MKKTLLLISSLVAFSFADVHLYTCGVAVGGADATFDICMDSDESVGGIQFTFDGGGSGFSVTGASGGAAGDAGFTLSTSPTGTVLGFSFTGASIDAAQGQLLLSVAGTFTDGSETTIGPTMGPSDAFSTPSASSIPVTTASSQWDGGETLDGSSALPSVYGLSEATIQSFTTIPLT
jgi:hypothetical protein